MIKIPVSTVEKPLTAIDFIAAMDGCITPREVSGFSERVPEAVRNDERFARAVAAKLDALRKRKRA